MKANGDLSSTAFNPLRDTVFMGNQEIYDNTKNVFAFTAGAMIPIGKAYGELGKLSLRTVGTIVGEEIISDQAGNLANMAVTEIGEQLDWSPYFTQTFAMGTGIWASNKTSNTLVGLDQKFNISGNFPNTHINNRAGYGITKETVPFLSDFFDGADNGINRGIDEGTFYSVKNDNGGEIYVSTDTISQKNFEDIIEKADGNINILTGTHGDIDGELIPYNKFFEDDYKRWGNNPQTKVFDITKLSLDELSSILNSNGINICAWCFSERSEKVLKALGLI